MQTRILSYEDCIGQLDWPGAVDALRRGHQLPRPELGDLLLGPGEGRILNRAAHIPGLGFAVKAETVFPGNAARGLPSVQGAVLLFDAGTGAIRAVIESRLVTQFKTAADSLLGAQCLARSESRHLVIVGAGAMAETVARAYVAAFGRLERISVWSRRPEQALALIARLRGLRADVGAVADLPQALKTADIVSAATMSTEALLLGAQIRPGTHVDLIGAYTPDMREADDALIASGLVYVDCMATVMDRIGDVVMPILSGAIDRSHIRGDLYDLVAVGGSSRSSPDQVTVFKNGGGAHLDLMMASHIFDTCAGG